MVEEFIAGSDLAASLIDGQPWQRSRVSDFFAALCDGLSALRSANIVHRDLKPTNIRVRTNGSPVIIDFGLARLLDLPDLTKTANGAAIGTPAYFAPEQADPASTKHNIDHRTDLFSVGVMLYQALVGSHPFLKPGMSCQELRSAICTAADWRSQPGFVSLPNPWKLITAKLLEKERARRPLEAEQVGSILRKLGGV
jgi:serine/threonine-protein kinase